MSFPNRALLMYYILVGMCGLNLSFSFCISRREISIDATLTCRKGRLD